MGIKITALMLYIADSKVLSGKAKMRTSSSMFIYENTEFRINQIWEHQNPAEPSTALALYLDNDVTIHVSVADLERLFGVINAHLEVVEKARKAEKDAERYAEAMFDNYLSADDLFDQDDLKHLDA